MSLTHAVPPAETFSIGGSNAELLYAKCVALAHNLWWTWHPEVGEIFRDLDPLRWRQLDHNPIRLLREFRPGRLDARASDMALHARIHGAYRQLNAYLATSQPTWGGRHAGALHARPVAYLSSEYAIHESLPIYSRQLGLNAGDHLKSASDLGIPLVAIGLYYDQGTFRQRLDAEGYQVEEPVATSTGDLPLEQIDEGAAKPLIVRVETRTGELRARVWLLRVGRVRVFLLDSNVPENRGEDRSLTSRFAGSDPRTRLRQQLLLGIGGVQLLQQLALEPSVYHLNDVECALAPLAVIRKLMESDGLGFEDAVRQTAGCTVFTHHAAVGPHSDRFVVDLVEEHLGPLRDAFGVSIDRLLALGRVEPQNASEPLSTFTSSLKLSSQTLGVSSIHGQSIRQASAQVWPWRGIDQLPIGHITQSVHAASWMSSPMRQLFARSFSDDWSQRLFEADAWQAIADVDSGELWTTQSELKANMLAFVRRRVSRQCRRRGECDDAVETARCLLDPETLTLGCAAWEISARADLILSDVDRLCALLNDEQRPLQIVFAGRAPAQDDSAKSLIQTLANARLNPRFDNRIVFIEDFDINVCRHLVQGVDVWLSHPRRHAEVFDTCGQCVTLNGGLNCATLDGWWAEAYDGQNGFAIGRRSAHVSDAVNDQRDAEALYETLESQVAPAFYQRDSDGLPTEWLRRVKHSISSLAWRFNADRMVADYTRATYLRAAGALSCQV